MVKGGRPKYKIFPSKGKNEEQSEYYKRYIHDLFKQTLPYLLMFINVLENL